ncbi:MAG: hypothetical protein ABIP94_24300 [Planctomycetota bacterium]
MNPTRPLFAILAITALAGALTAQQQIVLPDNHYLAESPTQVGSSGSTAWWRTTAGHFQMIYEGSHFTNHGVTGPITINRLKFRSECGEVNLGGQIYTGVTVELGSTSLTTTTYNTTTFATNRAPASTTMGPLGTASVTVAPSTTAWPGPFVIDIDLAAIGASIVFDPTGLQPNLIIDITIPTAPTNNAAPLALVPMQDNTGGVTVVRGRGITTATPAALTGTASTTPLLVGLEFSGSGGYSTLVPAKNEFYGAACGGSPSSFYQAFLMGQPFDLQAGLTMTPDNAAAPNTYAVTSGAPAPDTTKVGVTALSIADDALVTYPMGFTFAFPGGSTSTILPCTNGFIWLDPTMTSSDFSAQIGDLLGSLANWGARLSPCWHDFNCGRNTGLNPLAGLHAVTDTTGGAGNNVCYVTWWDIGEFNVVSGTGIFGHTVWTMQCVLYEATGVVQFRYGPMPPVCSGSLATAGSHPSIVGFSRGRIGGSLGTPSVDPQSRDLSHEIPFTTAIEGSSGNIGQIAVATPNAGGAQYGGRFFPGQVVTWNAVNIPAGALCGVQLLDVGGSMPGLSPLAGSIASGCVLSTTTNATIWEVTFFPPSTVVGTRPCVEGSGYQPAVIGTNLYAQYVLLDGLFNPALPLISAASNAIKHTAGLN